MMKVICDRAALVESLNLVGAVALTRTPKPVLSCVQLTAKESSLTLAATDLEVAVHISTAQVDVQAPGQALVPADKLSQIVRESIETTLTIEVDQDVVHVRGEDSHFQVFGQPPGDFPPVPQFTDEPDFQVSASDLHQLISQTVFATARENSRYAINGVLIEREGDKLAVVATDGRRLALAKGTCQSATDTSRAVIVPTKALQIAQRLFADSQQLVKVRVAENQVLFADENSVLASNLVEGNFPPYRDVIPQDGDKKVTIQTSVLASAVRRAALLTNEESKGVKMSFSADGLAITSRAPEMGRAEIKVPVQGYTGDPVKVGFNPQFILDALKVTDADEIHLELKAPNKPGVFRVGKGFQYVVMPVNLQEVDDQDDDAK